MWYCVVVPVVEGLGRPVPGLEALVDLHEDGVLALGVEGGVTPVLHGHTTVDEQLRHARPSVTQTTVIGRHEQDQLV